MSNGIIYGLVLFFFVSVQSKPPVMKVFTQMKVPQNAQCVRPDFIARTLSIPMCINVKVVLTPRVEQPSAKPVLLALRVPLPPRVCVNLVVWDSMRLLEAPTAPTVLQDTRAL